MPFEKLMREMSSSDPNTGSPSIAITRSSGWMPAFLAAPPGSGYRKTFISGWKNGAVIFSPGMSVSLIPGV